MYIQLINVYEKNHIYKTTVLCEPQLGKRGLFPTISTKTTDKQILVMMNIIAYCDGTHDLLWIAEKIEQPIFEIFPVVVKLLKHGLIIKID